MASEADRVLTRLAEMLVAYSTVLLSGTRLANELGVSRSTVWHGMEQLRAFGVGLEGHPGTGYRLRALPDLLLPSLLRPSLETRRFGGKIHHAFRMPSTQQAALEAAADPVLGVQEGELWVAETQTAGRGRQGHAWSSPPGTGIYASLVLRPQGPPAALLPLTLLAGLAVADAVEETTGLRADIRWPNDLLLEGRKFAGLLLEMSAEATRIHHAVLGIGINVHTREFPPELADIATSLALHRERRPSRVQLLGAVLRHLEARYLRFFSAGPAAVLEEFQARSSYARGLRVRAGELEGVTAGLDASGFLRLRQDDGTVTTVISGDVRPLR